MDCLSLLAVLGEGEEVEEDEGREEEVEEEEVEVVTLLKHLPISSTSTTALREKVGLRERNVKHTTEICDFCTYFHYKCE